MKKIMSILLIFMMLISFFVPGTVVLAAGETDVTGKVVQSPPDVILKNAKWDSATNQYIDKYIIQDGVVVDDQLKPSNGQMIEIVYKWSVPNMVNSGIQDGDFFLVDLPDLTHLKPSGFNPNEETPIVVPKADNPGESEILGTAVVDTGNGYIKAKFNALAIGKQDITNGFFKLKFQATTHLNVTYNPNAGAGEDAIVITKREGSVDPLGTGEQGVRPLLDKRGAEYNANLTGGGTELRLGWTVYVNQDQIKGYLENGTLETRNNLWMEDEMSDSALKILEDNIYIYVDQNLATPAGKLSNYTFYSPNYRAGSSDKVRLVKSLPTDENFAKFKARVQALPVESGVITVYLYQAKTDTDKDGLLICFGNINEQDAPTYDDFNPNLDTTLIGVLDKLKNPTDGSPARITEEQYNYTKQLYGLDGDNSTPMKKVVGFRVFFHTLPKNDGKFANIVKTKWDGGESNPISILAKYAKFSAGAGYTDTTAVIVEKKWEGVVSGPISVRLLQDGNIYKAVTLGEPNPQNENEVKDWIYIFAKLPEKDASGRDYVYSVEEVNIPGYDVSYEPADRIAKAANSNKVVITNKYKAPPMITFTVQKEWTGPATGDVEVSLYGEDKNNALQTLTLTPTALTGTFAAVPEQNTAGNKIDYTLEETVVPANAEKVSITLDAVKKHFLVKNKNIEKVDATITKKWLGDGADKLIVYLTINGVKSDAPEHKIELKPNSDPSLSWKATITNLPKYDDSGNLIIYSFEEVLENGFSQKKLEQKDNDVLITNVNDAVFNLPIEKKWIGPKGEPVHIALLAEGVQVPGVVKTLSDANGWKDAFENLRVFDENTGARINYTVEEINPPNNHEVLLSFKNGQNIDEGYLITNKNTGKIDILVTKKWVNSSVSSVFVYLMEGDDVVDEVELNEGNQWKHIFKGLYQYNQVTGAEFNYYVTEKPVPNFSTSIVGDIAKGFVITNTYLEPLQPYIPGGDEDDDDEDGDTGSNTDNPKPPVPPTNQLPENPIPEGKPQDKPETKPETKPEEKPQPTTPPETTLPENPIPEGKTELPKTGGTPAGAAQFLGFAVSVIGYILKKKK